MSRTDLAQVTRWQKSVTTAVLMVQPSGWYYQGFGTRSSSTCSATIVNSLQIAEDHVIDPETFGVVDPKTPVSKGPIYEGPIYLSRIVSLDIGLVLKP